MLGHTYCPHCAAPLQTRAIGGRDRPACPACRYVQFNSVSLGVGGVVVQAGRVLLIRRGQNPGRDRWTLPGGYVEADETFDDACLREVEEETGLVCRNLGLLAVRHRLHTPDIYAAFLLAPIGGEVDPARDLEEVAELGWFDAAGLATLPDLAPLSHELALLGLGDAPRFQRKVLAGYDDTQCFYGSPLD